LDILYDEKRVILGANQQGANAVQGRWLVIPRTLSFVVYGQDVLLMKRGAHKRVFPNQYNGLGGHIESDEDPYTSALREIKEESNLSVVDLRMVAVHHIYTGGENGILLFVFVGRALQREFMSDEREGTLHWIPIADVQSYDLVEDLYHILPAYLDTSVVEPRFAYVTYDNNDQIQLRYAERDAQ
jgi:8-oxo-dGTP diphosphatase